MRSWLAGAVATLVALGATPLAGQGIHAPPGDQGGTIVFLVRHAETIPDGTRDPALSGTGRERAARLAAMLVDAGIDAVLSTDYTRTRDTAGPVADALGLDVSIYDPGDLDAVAERLAARGGRVLVVGHSNTTPALVAALGGEPGPPIAETEHDRLYVVVPGTGNGAPVETLLVRY